MAALSAVEGLSAATCSQKQIKRRRRRLLYLRNQASQRHKVHGPNRPAHIVGFHGWVHKNRAMHPLDWNAQVLAQLVCHARISLATNGLLSKRLREETARGIHAGASRKAILVDVKLGRQVAAVSLQKPGRKLLCDQNRHANVRFRPCVALLDPHVAVCHLAHFVDANIVSIPVTVRFHRLNEVVIFTSQDPCIFSRAIP